MLTLITDISTTTLTTWVNDKTRRNTLSGIEIINILVELNLRGVTGYPHGLCSNQNCFNPACDFEGDLCHECWVALEENHYNSLHEAFYGEGMQIFDTHETVVRRSL